MLFLGVDLAWGEGTAAAPPNRSGVAVLDGAGAIRTAGWTVGLDETLAWVAAQPAAGSRLFVDAPLVVTNPAGMRRCDRQTGQRYGRWGVSANAVNLASPRLAGVRLRERLEAAGWRYDDGRVGRAHGHTPRGRFVSECYPYATLVGVPELGYDRRPAYKRSARAMPAAWAWPIRVAACDELIRRVAGLTSFDPPVDLRSHPETARLLAERRRRGGGTTSPARTSSTPSSAPGPPRTGTAGASTGARCSVMTNRQGPRRTRRSSSPRGPSSGGRCGRAAARVFA